MTDYQHTDATGFSLGVKKSGPIVHLAVALPGGEAGAWVDVPGEELRDALNRMYPGPEDADYDRPRASCGARVCSADYTLGPHTHGGGVITPRVVVT